MSHLKCLPVILCGGAGTRLWPESRRALPKQFLPLLGDASFFRAALRRCALFAPGVEPLILTNEAMRFLVQAELEKEGCTAQIVLEPEGRDTAAAIACAALIARRYGPQTGIALLPSDHFIGDDALFAQDMRCALQAAAEGFITVFGIQPNAPSTAYGYIEPGATLPVVEGLRRVVAFHEKPDAARAATFLSAGRLWNSGLFIARADVLITAFEAQAPAILRHVQTALEHGSRDGAFFRLDGKAFAQAPKKPFDIAIMEKTQGAAVLPARFAWSDIGAWDALWQVAPQDTDSNALHGAVVVEDVTGALVRSTGPLTAVLGLHDIAVIVTPDAVLVAPKNRMQDVKPLVARLEARGCKEVAEHPATVRPWGQYETKDLGARYRVKRITVKPGGRLSLQKHAHRSEHWVVVRGMARVTIEDATHDLCENQSTYIPIGTVHRLENQGKIPLELIEVQVGSYLEEDDIVRLDDAYGRQ